MAEEVILTKEGKEELEKKLEYLKLVKRAEITERIKTAREFGDLSENAEYDAAKNEQAMIEGEILELGLLAVEPILHLGEFVGQVFTGIVDLGGQLLVQFTEGRKGVDGCFQLFEILEYLWAQLIVDLLPNSGKVLFGNLPEVADDLLAELIRVVGHRLQLQEPLGNLFGGYGVVETPLDCIVVIDVYLDDSVLEAGNKAVYLLGEPLDALVEVGVGGFIKAELTLPIIGRDIRAARRMIDKVEACQPRAQLTLKDSMADAGAEIGAQAEPAFEEGPTDDIKQLVGCLGSSIVGIMGGIANGFAQ